MGDRSNICVLQSRESRAVGGHDGAVWMYGHWLGAGAAEVLSEALARGYGRWDDEAYLSRIIFSEMIRESVLDETGYGLSVYPIDNEYPILVVDVRAKKVLIVPAERRYSVKPPYIPDVSNPINEWTFADYVGNGWTQAIDIMTGTDDA